MSDQQSGDQQSECQERDTHPGQDESRSRWRGLDALSVWWWHILADRNHRELFWHRSKWRVMIRKSPSFKYKLKKRERCNPLVDWFNTRVSRGAKLRGELVPKLLCSAPKLFIWHTDLRTEESPLSCHQHKSHVRPSPEPHTSYTVPRCWPII